MKLYVSIPEELAARNFSKTWKQIQDRVKSKYPYSEIISRYTGNQLEEANFVVFLYDYKENRTCVEDMQKCRELSIPYNFIVKIYAE